MALTAEQQALFNEALKLLPSDFANSEREYEITAAFAAMSGAIRSEGTDYVKSGKISFASGGPPDFLELHARDRGTHRLAGESDAALRERLGQTAQTLTFQSLTTTAIGVLNSRGVPSAGTTILGLREHKAFFGSNVSESGTGGTFVSGGFDPGVSLAYWPNIRNVTFSGAASAGNNGTFVITALSGNIYVFSNGGAVLEADPTVSWSIAKEDALGIDISNRAHSYLSRGFRIGPNRAAIVAMLPFGCASADVSAVFEALRSVVGAGVLILVECRANP